MRFAGFKWNSAVMCLIGIGLCLLPVDILGQQEATLILEEIEVTAKRIRLSDVGKHTETIDSQMLDTRAYSNISEVLAFQTPLHVRSQGLGTLATLGIRGASAVHTQFLWNGIPLRNPMLGVIDIALLPSFFTDEVAIHYGGHGAAFGSGAIGGLISLSNKPISKVNQLGVHLSAGSWGTYLGEVKYDYGSAKFRFSTRFFYQEADNDYKYKLNSSLPEKTQVHHHLTNSGLLQEATWFINEKESLTARLWLQGTNRQIPPTSTQSVSKAAQQDRSLRTSLQWMRKGKKVDWQVKTAILEENIAYQDSLILLFTNNRFHTWLTEFETSIQLNPRLNFTGGIFTEFVHASSASYRQLHERDQYGAFVSFKYLLEDWIIRFQMREERTDQRWSPLLVDFSTEWSGIKNFSIKSSLSRNYRFPTMNDLYWRPGGNQNLSPEQGWTFETGIHYRIEKGNWVFKTSGTGFVRSIEDWILWLPPEGNNRNFWTPTNIIQVNSVGTEFRSDISWNVSKWTTSLTVGFDLNWSTFSEELPEFMIEAGDQLFYVPVQNVLVGFSVGQKQWSGFYHHHWFGDSNGINESVSAGNIGSAGVSFNPNRKAKLWSVYLQADNVWNVPYRLIERRPMPGRSIKAGVRFVIR